MAAILSGLQCANALVSSYQNGINGGPKGKRHLNTLESDRPIQIKIEYFRCHWRTHNSNQWMAHFGDVIQWLID